MKNVDTTLPAGLIGNPLAVPRCSDADFATGDRGDVNAVSRGHGVGRRRGDAQRNPIASALERRSRCRCSTWNPPKANRHVSGSSSWACR